MRCLDEHTGQTTLSGHSRMRDIVNSRTKYTRAFPITVNGSGGKTSLESALDIRKFEIELYWKRATYFWTLIAASFAGFFALASKDTPPHRLLFLTACIGSVLSTAWYLVNRGSKYWQENWERHVDVLEEQAYGPLYRTVLARDEFKWHRLFSGYPYSVSRINQIVSLYVACLWFSLSVITFPSARRTDLSNVVLDYGLAGLTLVTLGTLVLCGFSRKDGAPRTVNFRMSRLRGARHKTPRGRLLLKKLRKRQKSRAKKLPGVPAGPFTNKGSRPMATPVDD